MSPEVTTLETGTDIINAADQFMHSRFRRYPVMAHGRMIGLICRHDVLVALEELWSAD
jgi:predicted transcriptional regulator